MFLPSSCTALMQPMYQSDIRILKLNYHKSFPIAILSSSEKMLGIELIEIFLKNVLIKFCMMKNCTQMMKFLAAKTQRPHRTS